MYASRPCVNEESHNEIYSHFQIRDHMPCILVNKEIKTSLFYEIKPYTEFWRFFEVE